MTSARSSSWPTRACRGRTCNGLGSAKLLEMVEAGHVESVLLWRLDRLSRNLADLILLADRFGQAGVALHSFTEQLDLSSATGRMFFNILGSFAQYYREALSENVSMGMAQARRNGRFVSRPALGFDLRDGILTPNEHAATVRRIFTMRADGASQGDISRATGVKHSTVVNALNNRHYLGEIKQGEEWLPGLHEPLIAPELFEAAHRGRVPGRKRGRDLMSGRVVCGLCGRRMSVEENGQGQKHYRCKHRGEGCRQPARSNRGLLASFALALRLLCDSELRDAIRQHLEDRRQPAGGRRRRTSGAAEHLQKLYDQRTKLLRLHYDDLISADQFGEEQARLTAEIENHEAEANAAALEAVELDDLGRRFEEVAALVDQLDLDRLWDAANETEKRTLLDELLDNVTVHPDRLEVRIHGAPPLNVGFSEVGLKDSELSRVGGGT